MSQRIKVKFIPTEDLISSLVTDLAMQGFNIHMEPCKETEHYVMVAELLYEGDAPELFPSGPTIH
ncbi:hypothetical protein D3C71_276540 [compost metagenome]